MIARALGVRRRTVLWLGVIALAVGLVLPRIIYIGLATDIVIWALFAAAFDLLLGYTGLLSFGHAMFWGGASYITGLLILRAHWSFIPALLAGMLGAALMAAIVGAVSIRRQGIYFAMITLAFGQMLYFLTNQLGDITGGQDGLQGVPRPAVFGHLTLENDWLFYYTTLAIAALSIAFMLRVVSSPFGQVLTAIRENETRAMSLGYRTNIFKLMAFIISAALSGLAGSLYVVAHRFTSLDTLQWQTSGQVVIMTVLGGLGTIFGPLFGAAFYLVTNDRLSTLANASNPTLAQLGHSPGLVLGIIFIVVVSLFRRGIVGELLHALNRRAM